jgi:integrase/recombinase XerD
VPGLPAGGGSLTAHDPLMAGRTALFLGWCAAAGVDWRRFEVAELARFKHWLEITPIRKGQTRSGSTINAACAA